MVDGVNSLNRTQAMRILGVTYEQLGLIVKIPMQSKVQEIIQTKEYTNMLENQSALDCQSHFFRRGLLDPSCNMLQHHANIHVFMMSQEYAIHVQHSIHHSKIPKQIQCLQAFSGGLHFAQVGIAFSESFIFCGLAETQLLHGYADSSLGSTFAVVGQLDKTTCTCST